MDTLRLTSPETAALRTLLGASALLRCALALHEFDNPHDELGIDRGGATAVVYAGGDPTRARRTIEEHGTVDCIDWHSGVARTQATFRVRLHDSDVDVAVVITDGGLHETWSRPALPVTGAA